MSACYTATKIISLCGLIQVVAVSIAQSSQDDVNKCYQKAFDGSDLAFIPGDMSLPECDRLIESRKFPQKNLVKSAPRGSPHSNEAVQPTIICHLMIDGSCMDGKSTGGAGGPGGNSFPTYKFYFGAPTGGAGGAGGSANSSTK